MKYIPILYNTLMVQALLAGRKTMTRRTNGLEKISELATEIVRSDQWKKYGWTNKGTRKWCWEEEGGEEDVPV